MRLSLRLAWRSARAHRLSTALSAFLVAIPVIALVALSILARSAQIPIGEENTRRFGSAELLLQQAKAPARPLTAADLPVGSRVADDSRQQTRLSAPVRSVLERRALSYDQPLAAGTIRQRTGRAPVAPDEVALTTALASQLHSSLGTRLTFDGGRTVTVVGTVTDPLDIRAREAIGPSGTLDDPGALSVQRAYLVSLPAGQSVDPSFTPPENYDFQFRDPRQFSASVTASTLRSGFLVVLLALLEAALTAGAAFAVAARRSRRDLALVAVNGGTRRQVATMVLAHGAVMGALGVVAGVVVGGAIGLVGIPLLQHRTAELIDGPRIDPRLILASAAFGLVSALLASLLPARLAARSSLRTALGGTRGVTRTPVAVTVVGAVTFGTGVLVTAGSSSSRYGSPSTTSVLLGVLLVELGAVALCPVLLGLTGRLGARLPMLPRLAFRDASRQRARSGPAVAAIAAAVSGAIAAAVVGASHDLRDRQQYTPQVARDIVVLTAGELPVTPADVAAVVGPARADEAATVRTLDGGYDQQQEGGATGAPAQPGSPGPVVLESPDVWVLSPAGVRALGGTPAAAQALADGALVLSALVPPGVHPLTLLGGTALPELRRVPAGFADPQGKPLVMLSPASAAAAHLRLGLPETVVPIPAGLSRSDRLALEARAADDGIYAFLEAGFGGGSAQLAAAVLLAIATAFALIVTAGATALAAIEATPDLAVMASVGATGRVRRLFTAAQGATLAVTGAVLGVLIGLVPGIAVLRADRSRPPLVIPWTALVVVLIGLPLLAWLGGLLFSRSRLPGPPRLT